MFFSKCQRRCSLRRCPLSPPSNGHAQTRAFAGRVLHVAMRCIGGCARRSNFCWADMRTSSHRPSSWGSVQVRVFGREHALTGRVCRDAAGQTCASQRSLHNTPIFRLLLKVAVNGTHQCDSFNFCGSFGPQLSVSWMALDRASSLDVCLRQSEIWSPLPARSSCE